MSVKNELDTLLPKLLEVYKATPDGFPKPPRRKDIDSRIYIGELDASGWCKWKPYEQTSDKDFSEI